MIITAAEFTFAKYQAGDFGDHVIINADCRDVLPRIPDKAIDLVLTDPPYGINYNGEREPQGKHIFSHRSNTDKVIGDDESFDPTFLLNIGRARILWGANCYASRLPDSPKWLSWDKVTRNGLNLRIAEIEFAWTDCVGRSQVFRHLWSGGYRESESGDFLHPTQKPIRLMEWCATRAGVPIGLILDPFAGSCTTAVAAKNLGRRSICIEISLDYCKIGEQRLAQGVLPL